MFETTDEIPASLQTSPLVSPAGSPQVPEGDIAASLQEPEFLDLEKSHGDAVSEGAKTPPTMPVSRQLRATTDLGKESPGSFTGQVANDIKVPSLHCHAHQQSQTSVPPTTTRCYANQASTTHYRRTYCQPTFHDLPPSNRNLATTWYSLRTSPQSQEVALAAPLHFPRRRRCHARFLSPRNYPGPTFHHMSPIPATSCWI